MIIKTKNLKFFGIFFLSLFVLVICILFIFYLNSNDNISKNPRGAVVTNGLGCAKIGRDILNKGGSAMDAAIAALFCEGVTVPQSMGLGGGFLLTYYSKDEGKAYSLDARETAPENSNINMFHGDSTLSTRGGLSIAVPGELRGYWEAYKKFGKLPWKELVQPTIDLCRNGIIVTNFTGYVLKLKKDLIYKDPFMREAYINPKTNDTYASYKYMKRLRLARALEIIAMEGGDALHNGSLTGDFVQDIQKSGGIITVNDMNNYKPRWQSPITVNLPFNQTLYTAPLPGSGVILSFILNILKESGFLDYSQFTLFNNWQRIIESFKFGYGKRTLLGDPKFINIEKLINNLISPNYATMIRKKIHDDRTFQNINYYGANNSQPYDHGTAHISVLAPNGDAVSVTSTINLYFGSGLMSEHTGIILNDEMDDFSSPNITNDFHIPPSSANFIAPGKRPLSSMCPTIIIDNKGEVRLIVGSAGGSKITTSVALVIIKHLWFNMDLKTAVDDRRIHHQLTPMIVELENTYGHDVDFLNNLTTIGHEYNVSEDNGFSAVTAISNYLHNIHPVNDKRRHGENVLVY